MKTRARSSEKTKEGVRLGAGGLIITCLIVAMAFLIEHYKDVKELKRDVDKCVIPDFTCPDDEYEDFFVVGVTDDNMTDLIYADSCQQLQIQKEQGYTSGGQVYVSKQGELWDLNAATLLGGNTITIYESTTWVERDKINLPVGCVGSNYDMSYHPLAGLDNRGQVWISCDANDVLVVYDPATRTLLSTIDLPDIYEPDYSFLEVVVGEDYAVASLINTTSAPGMLLQFSTEEMVVTAQKSLGAIPHLWYYGKCSSRLYVVSELDEVLYAINFETLVTEQTSVSVGAGISVTTDPYERFVYLIDGNSVGGVNSIRGFTTSDITIELSGSPYSTPIADPFDLAIGHNAVDAVVTYLSNNTISKFQVSRSLGDFSTSSMELEISDTGSGHEVIVINSICPCDLCVFYSSKKSNQKILSELALTASS